MSKFKQADRQTGYLMPPSMDEWLPEGHLARFIAEVIDSLDLTAFTCQYVKGGSAGYHPAILLSILVYGYATGTFSSRKLERATHDSVAFRYLAANTHPDHDTLANFRKRFLVQVEALFIQVLEVAQQMKLLKLGNINLDGTKIHANASKHSALSYGHIVKLESQFKAEVKELLALAAQADNAAVPDGMDLPQELRIREQRLAVMATAKTEIEARAAQRYQQEKAEYDGKLARRAAKETKTGKKPGGKPPKEPEAAPQDSDQVNLTDEESRIMPVAGGGFEQAYNAQAAVDGATLLIVTTHVSQAPNDKQQLEPVLDKLLELPEALGTVDSLNTDAGYCSEDNILMTEAAGIEPFMAVSRQEHHPGWRERHAEPPPLADDAGTLQRMAHKLKTQAGKAIYKMRKQTVEPVFGIIKSVMGFRQFSLRGLKNVSGEWTLVCLAWNLKRMAVLRHHYA
jgi:transposase